MSEIRNQNETVKKIREIGRFESDVKRTMEELEKGNQNEQNKDISTNNPNLVAEIDAMRKGEEEVIEK